MESLGENEVVEKSLVEYFEENINDDDTIIEFKLNNIVDHDGDIDYHLLDNVKNYVMFGIGANIKFSTAGLHLQGKNKVPHIHYHFICDKCIKPQNPTDRDWET